MAEKRRTAAERRQQDDLLRFPRPSVAVDVAVLTVSPTGGGEGWGGEGRPTLRVLLLQRTVEPDEGRWGLPGSFVRERETLDAAVLRTLADKCGIDGLAPRQLGVFDDPARDDRGWVLSVAHADTVPVATLVAAVEHRDDLVLAPVVDAPASTDDPEAQACPVALPGGQRRLPFDHDHIVERAIHDLRARYRREPDPDGLLREPFTLLELRRTHEAVLGHALPKDTFRRQMLPQLEELDRCAEGTVGRPARLHRRRA